MNAPQNPQGWQQPQQQWQQQPPPGQQGGYPPQGPPPQGPPQGYQQGPGYPPQQQKKKSKAPVVIAVVVLSILLLGGLGTGGFFFFNARKDRGYAPRNDALPEKCGSVSAETLAKARTTNPWAQLSSETEGDTNCTWQQAKGRDGSGFRMLHVKIWDKGDQFDGMVEMVTATSGVQSVTDVSGIGEQAKAVIVDRKSESFAEYVLVARKGDHAVVVEYTGGDPGLFSLGKPDMDELAEMAKTVMNEVLGKL